MRSSRKNKDKAWEKCLIGTVAGFVVLLLVVQILMLNATPRRFLSLVDRLEGESITRQSLLAENQLMLVDQLPVNRPATARVGKSIVIRMVTSKAQPGVYVTVNGQRSGNFAHGEVKLTVYDGDYVEIDASDCPEKLRFVVDVRDKAVRSPVNGLMLESTGGLLPVGKDQINSN